MKLLKMSRKLCLGLMTKDPEIDLDNLTNINLIDDMCLDYTIYKLNHRGYSDWYIWKIWLKGW